MTQEVLILIVSIWIRREGRWTTRGKTGKGSRGKGSSKKKSL